MAHYMNIAHYHTWHWDGLYACLQAIGCHTDSFVITF